jgi:hypothetical protein
VLWGSEERVRELFAPHGVELEMERHSLAWEAESVEAWLQEDEERLGPTIMAKEALEPQGKWEAARADMAAIYADMNEATDGSFSAPAEYLVTVATLPA